ncbi:PREDICTED: glutenin, high molecular weight subunit DX5-like [Nelumbo nucifera]|uniref:Glutenin, high molecular weight subunit DX5-like n=1 Tax=Nelumbo nucifera TaxID=4432 RepID=A0A1U8A2E0_NELNU|nr:PREDICTED: glutenin, high molecular weight subunit DX5-like [Nelumbo nucifera]
MDLSALTEAQQQQLQQFHQQLQQHQLQQQQEQQQQQQQQQIQQQQQDYYDPSQTQAYDQSTQAYYPYHHYQQQQHYAYYHPDYANAYQQPQQQQQPQPSAAQADSTPIQPPGISIPAEASQLLAAAAAAAAAQGQQQGQVHGQSQGQVQAHVQQQQNAYYPQGVGEQQQAANSSYPVPPGLNPAAAAAVAALSQLTHFAGTMDAAERAMAGLQERQWHTKNGGYGHMPPPGSMPYGPHGPFPMRPPVGRSAYRGGGRRGGGSFRGGGRGNFGQRQPRADGSGHHFRGRGRMGKGGRRFQQHAASSSASGQEPAALAQGEADVQGEALQAERQLQSVPAQPPVSAPVPGQSAPNRRPPQIAWCELCRVDCTSLDILEQHKNGKRHKKNLQRIEELKNAKKPLPAIQVEQKPLPALKSESMVQPASVQEIQPDNVQGMQPENIQGAQPENVEGLQADNMQGIQAEHVEGVQSENVLEAGPDNVQEGQPENVQGAGESKPPIAENLPTEAPSNENKIEIEQQNSSVEQPGTADVERAEAPGKRQRFGRFDSRRRGIKRKMRGGGRGGKRTRTSEGPRKPVEPPKPKEVVPLICDLCNVKCDTQTVFDCHLAGKKHLSKLKRFQGHQAMFGPVGLQALYPPSPSAHSTFVITQGHQQAFYSPHVFLPQQAAYRPPQAQQAAAASSQPQVQPLESQVTDVTLESGNEIAVAVESKKRQSVVVEMGNQQGHMVEAISEKIPESGGMEVGSSLDNLVVPASGNGDTRGNQTPSVKDDSGPVSDMGLPQPNTCEDSQP